MRCAALLAVLAGTLGVHAGCSGRAEFEDYCERSGDCQCTDGACCAIGGQPCTTGMSCCDGYACVDGACGWGPVPVVRFDPVAIEFGHTDRVPSAPRPFTLINVGTVATLPLDLYPTDLWNFALDGCIGAVLQPGERCTGAVTFVPSVAAAEPVARTFHVREVLPRLPPRPLASLRATGRAGHVLTVDADYVDVAADGVSCPPWGLPCAFGYDVPSVVSVASTAWLGFSLDVVAGGCATSPCDVHVEDVVQIHASARGHLRIIYTSTDVDGSMSVVSEAVRGYAQWCATYASPCDRGAFGPTTLTASLSAPEQIPEWGGACAGVSGLVCTLDVRGPTEVTLHLHR